MAEVLPPKPAEGTVAPVEVVNIWKHASVWIASLMAMVPLIIAFLVQLQQIPGLPTNVLAWIASAISGLTAAAVIYQKLFGTPQVTPTAAAKLIQTQAPNEPGA